MSTVKATNLQNASSTAINAITTSGGDLTNAAGVSFMGGSKNLLYNGAMQVAQRATSVASITTTGYYTADRYQVVNLTQGTWTNDIQNDAPTGSGLRKSLRMLCTTADASPAAADMIGIDQVLEGQDLQRLAKGTASAQQMTISFWVKSNVTGTYIVSMYDNDSSPARSVCGSYTISASATWEKKSITFPADLTGPFDNDNAASLYVRWYLGAGSNRTSGTLATAWATFAQANDAVGQVNVAAAINNYWQVTGVQLEVGPVATSFEFKPFGQELRECQRYYFKTFNQGVTPAQNTGSLQGALRASGAVTNTTFIASMSFPVTMRAAPTMTTFSPDNASANWSDQGGARAIVNNVSSGTNAFSCDGGSPVLAGGAYGIHATASAEL